MKRSLSQRKHSSKSKNKTVKMRKTSENNPIWDNYGYVLNPNTHTYVRLGGHESLKVIQGLKRDSEWRKRTEYIINHHGAFGNKLEAYLQK